MYNPLNPFSVLGYLKDLHPNLHSLSRINFPSYRAGHEWSFGHSTYIPRMFRYKYDKYKKLLNINEFLGVKLASIAEMSDTAAREKELHRFASTYAHDYIFESKTIGSEYTLMHQMPRARALGIASYYKRAGNVQDIDALEAGTPFSEWSAARIAEGHPIDPDKVSSYMYQTKQVSDLMPGFGTLEDIRKWSTLENTNIIGSASTPNSPAIFGGQQRLSITKGLNEAAYRQSQAYLYKTGEEHVMERAAQLTKTFVNTGMAHMVQYSTDASLQGGPFLYKEGLFKNMYTFPQKEIFLTPSEAMSVQRAIGSDLEGLAGSASLKANLTKEALIQSGMDPRRAQNILLAMKAQQRGDVMAIQSERKGTRIIFGKRQPIGPGTKLTVGRAKGLAAEVKAYEKTPYGYNRKLAGGFIDKVRSAAEFGSEDGLWRASLSEAGGNVAAATKIFKRANRPASILATTVKDKARNLSRAFEGAQLFLTHPNPLWGTPDEGTAAANAQRIASILGPQVEAVGRQLKFHQNMPLTEQHLEGMMNMLTPTQRAMLQAGKMPQWVHVIGESDRIKFGKLAGITINDIAGLKIQGLHRISQLYSSAIAMNPFGNQIKDVFGYLTGRHSSINALDVGVNDIPDLLDRAARGKGGRLSNYEGSLLFNPARDSGSPYMLNLGRDVNINIGGASRTINKLPLLSQGARGLVQGPGGRVYATPLDKPYMNLLQEMLKPTPNIESHVQKIIDVMGHLGGKKGLVDRLVARTKVQGFYGTMVFLSPEAEGTLQAAYGDRGGFIGLTMDMAKKVFPQHSESEIGAMFDEGLYLPVKRYPEAPRGTAVGRAFLMDKHFRDMANFGKESIYISPAIGAHVHGDLDKDMATIITEWAQASKKNPEIAAMMKDAYLQDLPRFQGFEQEVVNKLKENVDYTNYLQQTIGNAKEHPSWSEVAEAAEFKTHTTGAAYVTGMQTYEGALGLAERGKIEKYTPQYASDLAQVMFGIAESGINVKRREGDVFKAADLFTVLKEEDTTRLGSMADDVITQIHGDKYSGAGRHQFVQDLMQSARYGAESGSYGRRMEPYNQYRSLYKAENVSDIDRALNIMKPAQGTIMGDMVGSGAFRTAQALGNANERMKAPTGAKGFRRMAKEAITEFGQGLKEGRGWTSIAAGAVILAGVGLGLKKPGNIIVQANEQVNEAQAPVIQPRRQSNNRVVTESQYNARIYIRNVRKGDRKKFVDLGQAISGKYRNPSKVQVHLKDDTNDINYKRVFDDAYRRAMTQGMQ